MLSVALCLFAFASDGKVEPLETEIPVEAVLQMRLLQKDAEILRLQVCSEAGIKHRECIVDWQRGTAKKAELPKPEPPKPQAP